MHLLLAAGVRQESLAKDLVDVSLVPLLYALVADIVDSIRKIYSLTAITARHLFVILARSLLLRHGLIGRPVSLLLRRQRCGVNLRLTLLHRYNLHVVPLEEPSGLFVVVSVPLAELFLQHLDINPVPFSCPSAIYQGCMGMTRIILDFPARNGLPRLSLCYNEISG